RDPRSAIRDPRSVSLFDSQDSVPLLLELRTRQQALLQQRCELVQLIGDELCRWRIARRRLGFRGVRGCAVRDRVRGHCNLGDRRRHRERSGALLVGELDERRKADVLLLGRCDLRAKPIRREVVGALEVDHANDDQGLARWIEDDGGRRGARA
ncbi:MAG: hypothetical protein ABJD07_09025, partial [Gemmatimonadaceae bacterium]